MTSKKIAIAASDLLSSYGARVDKCWDGMLAARPALTAIERFPTEQFTSGSAAIVPGLVYHGGESLIWQMFSRLKVETLNSLPGDTSLLLATTVGEIDLLEKSVLAGEAPPPESHPLVLLEKCLKLWNIKTGKLVNAACASATLALAQGAAMIAAGKASCVVVAAADGVTEFVFSGFSALGAMSSGTAMPFDANRSGLALGEAAGIMVLMSAAEAEKRELPVLGYLTGWGSACDARHMTTPDESGIYLAGAINAALKTAALTSDDIGGIMAHGTGTFYNDVMEIAALRLVFGESGKPICSSKFGTGHTLGAAGIIQACLALKALEHGIIPPQGNLQTPMEGAENFVAFAPRSLDNSRVLSINAGFGGINAAVIFEN